MTSKRDLGPPLALAGLAVVVVAVIAGFIAVGGPGDARDQRLDAMTTGRIMNIASAANCAFTLDGAAPANTAAVRSAIERAGQRSPDGGVCDIYGSLPLNNQVEYSRLANDRIRVCSEFRRPYEPEAARETSYPNPRGNRFPELDAPRPAGHHCYDIQLVKPLPIPLN